VLTGADVVHAATASCRVFGPEGAHVVCDSVSFGLIRGSKIEWEDSLMRSAFVVGSNPNSEASCGCGSSFTARIITPPSKSKAAAGGGRKS
jgi:iron-sulfur cluster assembly accessory protein